MYAGLIRPTAANADLRPAQMPARSAGSSAARISVAPGRFAQRAHGRQLRLDLRGRAVQFHQQHRAAPAG